MQRDIIFLRYQNFSPRAQLDHTKWIATRDLFAGSQIANNTSGKEACDLSHTIAAIGRLRLLETDPHALVFQCALRVSGIKKKSRCILQFNHLTLARRSIDMNVEDGEKNANSNCGATNIRVVIKVSDFDNLAIGRGDKQITFFRDTSSRIAKKVGEG